MLVNVRKSWQNLVEVDTSRITVTKISMKVGKRSMEIGRKWQKFVKLVRGSSIKNEGNRIFWAQKITILKSIKFTCFIVYLLSKIHKLV